MRGRPLPRLEEIRSNRGMTRRQLAAQSGVDYVTLWRVERKSGGASPFTVRRIAAALDVSETALEETAIV